MKRIQLTIITFLLCSFCVFSAPKETIVKDILTEYVTLKMEEMQAVIKFDDEQRAQLQEIELKFLLDVQKAEVCACFNSQKKVRKLKEKRVQSLQKILTREQFIKYDAIENDRIKEGSLRAEEAN